ALVVKLNQEASIVPDESAQSVPAFKPIALADLVEGQVLQLEVVMRNQLPLRELKV
ncbi:unnamed protein product, partial [Prorocentrum cordatum]